MLSPSWSTNPFRRVVPDTRRAEELARLAETAGDVAAADAREIEANGGRLPWYRRVFRRRPPLPYQ